MAHAQSNSNRRVLEEVSTASPLPHAIAFEMETPVLDAVCLVNALIAAMESPHTDKATLAYLAHALQDKLVDVEEQWEQLFEVTKH